MTVYDFRPMTAKTARKRVTLPAKKAVVAALDAAPRGQRRSMVQGYAATYGVHPATVYRWVEQEHRGRLRTQEPKRMDPTVLDRAMELLYSFTGDVTATHRMLQAEGLYDLTVRRLRQQLTAEVDQLVRRSAGMDEHATRKLGTYVSYQVPHRDFEWQIDLVDLCVEVVTGFEQTEHAWATVVVDKRTGLTRGWCVTIGQPTASSVSHALVMAIQPRSEMLAQPDGTVTEVEIAGAPVVLRSDNGQQLLSDIVVGLMCEAGTAMDPAPLYAHTTQGAIERWNREAKRFSRPLFGSTRGTKTIRGKEHLRDGQPIMDVETIERLFVEHVRTHDRTPARGQTMSPLELYATEDARGDGYRGPVLSDAQLAQFSLQQVTRPRKAFKIDRGCVRRHNRRWTASPMAELRGTEVELWASTVDPNYLEVHAEGLAFQVFPVDQLPPDMVEDIIQRRNDSTRQANRLRKTGADLARERAQLAQDVTTGLQPAASNLGGGSASDGGDPEAPDPRSLADRLDEAFREVEP